MQSGRLDGENLFILESDNPLVWNEARMSQEPKYWWQFSVIGNCGSPVETEDGWLMLTHGVGPMEDEQIGYVPNVVYTCGCMRHNGSLIIPYAVSDVITKFAGVDVEELLAALKGC